MKCGKLLLLSTELPHCQLAILRFPSGSTSCLWKVQLAPQLQARTSAAPLWVHPPGKLGTSLQVSPPRHQSAASSKHKPEQYPALKQHGQRWLTCVFRDTCSTRAAVATFFNFALSASSVLSICLLLSASSTDTAATRTCSPCCAKRYSSKGPLHGSRRMTQQANEQTPLTFPPPAKTCPWLAAHLTGPLRSKCTRAKAPGRST